MIVFLLKLSELGSDRSQDDAVCRRRLFIFLSQGNISKILLVLERLGDSAQCGQDQEFERKKVLVK